LIVVLVIVTETFSLHFASVAGQYLVKQQQVAVAAAVAPEIISAILTESLKLQLLT